MTVVYWCFPVCVCVCRLIVLTAKPNFSFFPHFPSSFPVFLHHFTFPALWNSIFSIPPSLFQPIMVSLSPYFPFFHRTHTLWKGFTLPLKYFIKAFLFCSVFFPDYVPEFPRKFSFILNPHTLWNWMSLSPKYHPPPLITIILFIITDDI